MVVTSPIALTLFNRDQCGCDFGIFDQREEPQLGGVASGMMVENF